MKDNGYEEYDDVLPEEPNAEVVHWMDPRPLSFGPTGLALAVAGAFALGLATALIAVGVSRLSGPERRMSPPLERKIRRLS
jgi:hypothetical protein